jgi:hypothetical protein
MCATFPNPQDCLERTSTDISTDSESSNANNACANLSSIALTLLLPPAILAFSLHFPFVIPGVASAALDTYIPASYHYDTVHTRFDNSSWTWGTDYLLTAVMGILAVAILNTPGERCKMLKLYTAAILVCYGVSTLAGGYAHQTVHGVDMLNTQNFRMLWIICVGNVSFASCWMGLIGREVVRVFDSNPVPLGPVYLWPFYGVFMTVACAAGYMSFKRPACDIFIAGISQFPSTFYCLGGLIMGARNNHKKRQADIAVGKQVNRPMDKVLLRYKIMYCVGFIGNAPLLPMYPLLVQYTQMTLAEINTLLHSWLMIMWGMQGLSLWHLCQVVGDFEKDNKLALGKKD